MIDTRNFDPLTVAEMNELIDTWVIGGYDTAVLVDHLHARELETDQAHGEALAIQAQMALADMTLARAYVTLALRTALDTLTWAHAVTNAGSRVQRAFAKGYRFTAYSSGRLVVFHVGTGNPLDGTLVAHYDLADQDAAKRTAADYADTVEN